MRPNVIPREADEWRQRALGRTFGSVRIERADVSLDEDANDRTAIFLDLALTNPPEGADTWPYDDVRALHAALNDDACQLGLPLPWYVRLAPADPEPLEDEDEEPW